MGKPTEPGLWMDSFSSLEAGVNSDVPPVLLPKNQAAFITNATVRGGFITHRPPFINTALTFTSESVETNFKTGKFQGACYYKPDSDPECLIASISGRLFRIIPTSSATATVDDISIPGDLNSADAPQAWLWQFENFVAIQDGENACIFFDGNSSRRSDGEITVLGTTAAPFIAPQIGGIVQVTLTGPFLGIIGQIVLVGGRQYEVVPSATPTYDVLLTNLRETVTSLPTGTVIQSYSNRICQTASDQQFYCPSGSDAVVSIPIVGPIVGPTGSFKFTPPGGETTYPQHVPAGVSQIFISFDGSAEYFGPPSTTINTTAGNWNGGAMTPPYPGYIEFWTEKVSANFITIPAGSIMLRSGTNVVTTIGIASSQFDVPGIGEDVQITIDRPYSGADGASVWINNSQWLITKVGGDPLGNVVWLKNINDTAGTPRSGDITNVPELPAGRVGAYGMGRNWMSLTDARSYIGSDLVGGTSGTPVNDFRDAPMRTLENNYLAGGGKFRVPGSGLQINAMVFPATLDSSLGQGALQVLTQSITFSCNAPVNRLTDETGPGWQDMVNPIQTQSLVGAGALGEGVVVNGDIWFRHYNGIYSLRLARQEFQTSWSNTPQSVEMNRVLIEDDTSLLNFWHGAVFDNRLLTTATPTSSTGGVYHAAIVVMNLDPNSSLREKLPPVYDGIWTGLNTLKLLAGTFADVERAFAIVFDTDTNEIGLTEILKTTTRNTFDNNSEATGRITWSFESPALFYQPDTRQRELVRLTDGEIFIKDIAGDVEFAVYYRPDYLQDWTLWHYWEVSDSPNFQTRMGLGTPPTTGDDTTERANSVGYHHQVKVVIKGSCTILGANFFAATQPQSAMSRPIPPAASLTPLPA